MTRFKSWRYAMDHADSSETQVSTIDLQAVDAEQRVNLIRISAIASFYLIHLWHMSVPSLSEGTAGMLGLEAGQSVPAGVHLSVTLLCLGWLMQAFAVHLMIAHRRVSNGLVTAVTVGDFVWLTAILCLSSGPAGPMVSGYFLILMLTGVRFNLRLVRVATVVAAFSYLVLLGVTRWPLGIVEEIGLKTVPRYHQVMILVAIILSGVIVGQIVRHAYLIADAINQSPTTTEGT